MRGDLSLKFRYDIAVINRSARVYRGGNSVGANNRAATNRLIASKLTICKTIQTRRVIFVEHIKIGAIGNGAVKAPNLALGCGIHARGPEDHGHLNI